MKIFDAAFRVILLVFIAYFLYLLKGIESKMGKSEIGRYLQLNGQSLILDFKTRDVYFPKIKQ